MKTWQIACVLCVLCVLCVSAPALAPITPEEFFNDPMVSQEAKDKVIADGVSGLSDLSGYFENKIKEKQAINMQREKLQTHRVVGYKLEKDGTIIVGEDKKDKVKTLKVVDKKTNVTETFNVKENGNIKLVLTNKTTEVTITEDTGKTISMSIGVAGSSVMSKSIYEAHKRRG
jgi:hypothetical protein